MSEVDKAYSRLLQIRSLIHDRKNNALSDPLNEKLISWGFVDRGDSIKDARKNINSRFDELLRRSERSSFLDMCAVFENIVGSYVATAIGEARKNVKDQFSIVQFKDFREKFVRDSDSFEGINSIIHLIKDRDNELYNVLLKIRDTRNAIAHGKKHLGTDGVSGILIRDSFNRVLSIFDIE